MKNERIIEWINGLTEDQRKQAMLKLTKYLIQTNDIMFIDESLVPYWETCGEPIVPGQIVFSDTD